MTSNTVQATFKLATSISSALEVLRIVPNLLYIDELLENTTAVRVLNKR
jgi:hypothetical protein